MPFQKELPPSLHRYAPSQSVIETDRQDELILLDSATQQLFSLNETGKVIWRALPNHTVGAVADTVAESFDVDKDVATSEVQALVTYLLQEGLIIPVND